VRVLVIIMGVIFLTELQAASPVDLLSLEAITNDTQGEDAPLAHAVDSMELDFVITPGEYEPASLVVAATEKVEQLNFTVSDFSDAEGNALDGATLDIRIVKRWYQKQFGGFSPKHMQNLTSELLVYDDSLIRVSDGRNSLRLQDGSYVDISKPAKYRRPVTPSPAAFPVADAATLLPVNLEAGERRQFWFTLHVAAEVPAGLYQATVEVRVGDTAHHAIPVNVEVLPFALAEPVLEYSIYYRGRLDKDRPEGSISSDIKSKSQMLADLKNMRAHGITNPNVYQKLNSGLLEDYMELRQQAGFNTDKLYYLGINVVQNNDGNVRPRLTTEVQEARKLFAGYGVKDVFFFARDEARGEELVYQQPFWDAVKSAGGKIMAAGWQDTNNRPGNFTVLGGVEDLYVCLGTLEPAEAERWHAKGKLIYSYHNPPGGHELPATWRRNYGLLLWQAGYDGAMPYAWQHSFGNVWNEFDHYRHRDLAQAYPAMDQPIDTVQWEGFREGIDDVRYLSTLLRMLDTEAYRQSPYYRPALDWVEKLRTLPLPQADLDQVRAEIVGYILALMEWSESVEDSPVVMDLRVAPIESDLTASVSWQTSLRTDASVEAGGKVYKAVPRMKNHVVQLEDLKPGKSRQIEISNKVAATQDPFTQSLVVQADPGLTLDGVTDSVQTGSRLVTFVPGSDFRTSVAVVPDQSLLGWWRFSGRGRKLVDASGLEHDGELKGDAERANGWFGRGVSLDGAGSFVHFPDIEIPENGTASIEGWYRFRSLAMDEVKNIGLFSGVYQHGDSNHLYFSRTNDSCEIGSLLTRNTWHHIVVTWSGDVSTAACYVDGNKVLISVGRDAEEIREINGLAVGRSSNYLGGLVGSATNTFDGDIDEFRVWNRVLSHAEVKASYRGGREQLSLKMDKSAGKAQDLKVIGANAADEELSVER
jgi:hypothetical protein